MRSEEEEIVADLLNSLTEIPIDGEIAKAAGRYKSRFHASHSLLLPDALIAACAKKVNARLITLNIKHFPMDVGETFMYGTKGGEVYVLGDAAGRPLINAAGRPRVVINRTCLDFFVESFIAGDQYKGRGFVILIGIEFDGDCCVKDQETPYPASNLFSLASGGALYVRDPYKNSYLIS